ncbi:MAG: VPDSG-CTERM exosortase interaction domain protein [Parabacteroides sp.]|nr:VPDSG-CTERM exosortase interaction domain protein [Parabacteroides sp.]
MDKNSFFLGTLAGAAVAFANLVAIGLAYLMAASETPIQYLESPVNYENKNETSFKVLQVLGNAALAREANITTNSDTYLLYDTTYYGKTVLLIGENFYSDQIVKVKNPQRTGISVMNVKYRKYSTFNYN